MYCIKIELRPTSGLSFRRLPGSILDIATYPFVPPSTMSGYLRRVMMLAAGHGLPETRVAKKGVYYVLPQTTVATGALPSSDGCFGIYKTYRQGPSNFKHTAFSRLRETARGKTENFQLHTWEYLFCDLLTGFVLSENFEELDKFKSCLGWGCKIGKEGFAYVQSVSEPIQLQQSKKRARPSTLLTPSALCEEDYYVPFDSYGLYRHVYQSNQTDPEAGSDQATEVEGFQPYSAIVAKAEESLSLDYYHDNNEIYIPVSFYQQLTGELK